MPIDARIPMQFQPIQVEPPMNNLMRFMQLKGMQQQQRLSDLQEQRAQRELEVMQRDQQLRTNLLQQLTGSPAAGNAAVISQTGGLAPTRANAAIHEQAQPPMSRLPLEAVQADLAFNGGRGIASELFQRTRPNVKFEGGVAMDMNRVAPGTTIPNVSQSGQAFQLIPDQNAPGGYRVTVPAGAVDAYGQFQRANEQAKADFDMVRIYNPSTQREELVPRSSLVRQQQTPQQIGAQPNRVPPQVQAQRDQGRVQILQQELRNATNPSDIQAIQRELGRMGAPAGASVREKASAQTLDLGNQQFMKDVFPSVIEAGSTAGQTLTTLSTARRAIEGMGNTGWAEVAKAAVAPALAAIGVKGAENFATNAQLFQQAGMTRLWEVLNAAKGPQTEGDADRAQQTFIRLRDTKEKNLYVLDLAQAVAERDAARARFFREALPLAQAEGDLQKIDREWARIQPSVLNMPSMRKWQQAGKN